MPLDQLFERTVRIQRIPFASGIVAYSTFRDYGRSQGVCTNDSTALSNEDI